MGTADVILYAKWIANTYDLTIIAAPVDGGTTDPAAGTHTYDAGTVVDISAVEDNDDYEFVNWTGAVENSDDIKTTVTMDADQEVTANFTKIFTIEDLQLHANLANRGGGQGVWDLHVFILFKKNNSYKNGNFTIKIKSSQDSSDIEKYYPEGGGSTETIVIPRGQKRYPSGNDAWLLESVATGQGKPKDVLVEIWIYDNNGSLVAEPWKYAN